VIREVLGTRFGTVWGLRLLDWLLLAVLLALAFARPAAGRPAVMAPALALLLGFLVLSPGLSGHAGTSDPVAVLLPANAAHVLGMSFWGAGLGLLVAAVPAATRALEPPARTRLLAASLERFSPLALASVALLLATGVLQALLQVDALADLWDTAFGRAILVKAAILAALIGLGWWNRSRSLPRIRRAAESGETPGREGITLRRALRAEVVLVVGALAATAALTAYAPSGASAEGPLATTGTLGDARLELTVDPARVGLNEVHIYLSDPRTGAQYDRFRDVGVQLRLRAKRIGPLEPRVDKAGPGHWVARRAQVVPGGDWQLTVAGRVSEFEEHRARFEVDVE
jgi:copper transport protein